MSAILQLCQLYTQRGEVRKAGETDVSHKDYVLSWGPGYLKRSETINTPDLFTAFGVDRQSGKTVRLPTTEWPFDHAAVMPSPATHAILTVLKAGETVHQAGELPETPRVSKIHYEPPKTVCKRPFASIFPPSMENGDGTRCCASSRACATRRQRRCCQLPQPTAF